jgi:aldehyde:ferredoxin oxidoreductase
MDFVVEALNQAQGTSFDESFFHDLGAETLTMEWDFNKQAGFTEEDDELPSFFFDEPLEPTGKTQRHKAADVNKAMRALIG